MWLICGLGNFGDEYHNTRHNVGFIFLNQLANKFSLKLAFKSKFKGEFIKLTFRDHEIILLKPHTYMNLSGDSVHQVMHYYKIPSSHLIVIHDDLDLQLGKVRCKFGGGSGGHNGIKSIDNAMGNSYFRVKIGIGRPDGWDASSYVLSKISDQEQRVLNICSEGIINNLELLFEKNINVFIDLVMKYINHEMSVL